jgi:hypothetical protein
VGTGFRTKITHKSKLPAAIAMGNPPASLGHLPKHSAGCPETGISGN